MDWQVKLVSLYLLICNQYELSLWVSVQKFTNGGKKGFTDEEVMTIDLFGILNQLHEKKAIYRFARDYLKEWFPSLPGYEAFVYRVNRLSVAFQELVAALQEQRITEYDEGVYLIDSFPIALAKGQHAYTAKVATEVASRGYSATKKMYFHGVRTHVVARRRSGSLPEVEMIVLDEGARHDTPVFEQIRPMLGDNLLFGDQAYRTPDADQVEESQGLKVFTPIKKEKGQKELDPAEKAFSKEVSRIRQPIEALIGWLERKTKIESASLVRSTSALLTHIWGRLAAALLCNSCPELDF